MQSADAECDSTRIARSIQPRLESCRPQVVMPQFLPEFSRRAAGLVVRTSRNFSRPSCVYDRMASHRTSYSELEAEMNFPQLFAWRSVCYLLAIAAVSVSLLARGEKTDEVAQSAAKLPIKRIVLFSSGVGYFQHEGKVDGNATIDLKFRVENINDLLKSMILEDRSGGKISTVTYGSRDPITKTLQTFPIDLTDNPTLGEILDQIRGQRVQIEQPTAVSGVLLGVEKRKREIGNDQVVDVEYLNLLTDTGIRSIPLDAIGSVKLLD